MKIYKFNRKCSSIISRLLSIAAVLVVLLGQVPMRALALSQDDINDINAGHTYFKPLELPADSTLLGDKCGVGSAVVSPPLTKDGTNGGVSEDGNPFHVMIYPPVPNDQAAASAIDSYIANYGNKQSLFRGLGADIVAGAKKSNVNPFLAVGHLVRENSLMSKTNAYSWALNSYTTAAGALNQTAALRIPNTYNGFGNMRTDSIYGYYRSVNPNTGVPYAREVKKWDSWKDSINGPRDWFTYIRFAYLNIGSIHNTQTWDAYVSKYVGTTTPDAYKAGLYNTIDNIVDIMNNSFTQAVATNNTAGICAPNAPVVEKPTGEAANYITDCSGNAAIACTAINQLSGLPYSKSIPPTTSTNPTQIDCSGLINMAIYRAYGLNLNYCSDNYHRNDTYFQTITDMHTLKPGDIVGLGENCALGLPTDGHVGIVVSYDITKPVKQRLITVEASTSTLSGIHGSIPNSTVGYFSMGIAIDNPPTNHPYTWARRYIGSTALKLGAN